MAVVVTTITEMWDQNSYARLSAHCVHERLQNFAQDKLDGLSQQQVDCVPLSDPLEPSDAEDTPNLSGGSS